MTPDAALLDALTTMLGRPVLDAEAESAPLHGGTLGEVRLVTGTARTRDGERVPFRLVHKRQRRWGRHGDPGSWRREYDLYSSDLGAWFGEGLRWPTCYRAQIDEAETEIQLWLEYAEGVSGTDLAPEQYERAALGLGRFQGRLHAEAPATLAELTNLSGVGFVEAFYRHYRSWPFVHDYVRSTECELPAHLRAMLIAVDDDDAAILERIALLPVVLNHRDFWVANVIATGGEDGDGGGGGDVGGGDGAGGGEILLIDWDTAGWGPLGEDLASLLADEADVDNLVENYSRCLAAYYRGFGEHVDTSGITDDCVYELTLLMFGYRLVEWFRNAETPHEKDLHRRTLEAIYQVGLLRAG